jgi:small-conductance mechanosensitive channel
MDIQEINETIMFGSYTNDELTSVINAVKFARSCLQKQTIRSLRVGDNVNFDSVKLGRNITGVVTKIAIKYVTVKTVQGLWKVPANMLSLIEEFETA